LDAPASTFAKAYAHADYPLWFANQIGRYNIRNGIMPPASGHWLNNPCADDIDFQIEADFAGIMCPGMVNAASEYCDRVGHIMNYGDGWYGGVYVAAMYALAFVSDDVEYVVEEALKTVPEESKFAQCISDVIRWHKEDPSDWKATWFKTHRKWSEDVGSAMGVFRPFNIDAKINAAWVVMGLLYGDGDFTRTFEISTRCGDDADCNPATAGGILAAMKGYDAIPVFWKQGLAEVEPMDFQYTTISLNDAYQLSYKHALEVIKRNGGEVGDDDITIKIQPPRTVPLEVSFEGHYPKARIYLEKVVEDEISFEFEGIGFVIDGAATARGDEHYVFETEMYIDGEFVEKVKLPTEENKRRFYLYWRYQLPMKRHSVSFKVLNPTDKAELRLEHAITYADTPTSHKF
jgi:hypothetical protein